MGYGSISKDMAAKKSRTSGASGETGRNKQAKSSSPMKQSSAKQPAKPAIKRAPSNGK